MRILILTQYYPPEAGAAQNRLSDLARRLAESGHTITVLTALPSYPKGEIFEGYRGCFTVVEQSDGIRIIRTWIYPLRMPSFGVRLLNYLSFAFSSVALGAWKIGKQDCVVAESPPLFLLISGFIISWLKRSSFVLNVSDLWPASAVAMGILRSRVLIALSTRLEEFLYRRSDLITAQTQGMVENIRSRCPGRRVELITNGVDAEGFPDALHPELRTRVRKEFEIEEKFVVGYAGLHGLAQGLETVLGAATVLAGHEDIAFALFGEGPEKDRLMRLTRQALLTNVHFYPAQPTSRMPEVLSLFDCAVIPLKRLDLFHGALPSKMFEAMAASVPVIVGVDGEARRLVDKAQAGICVEPENPKALADAILKLHRDPACRKAMGEHGRAYVIEHYDRKRIVRQFERLLAGLDHLHAVGPKL